MGGHQGQGAAHHTHDVQGEGLSEVEGGLVANLKDDLHCTCGCPCLDTVQLPLRMHSSTPACTSLVVSSALEGAGAATGQPPSRVKWGGGVPSAPGILPCSSICSTQRVKHLSQHCSQAALTRVQPYSVTHTTHTTTLDMLCCVVLAAGRAAWLPQG